MDLFAHVKLLLVCWQVWISFGFTPGFAQTWISMHLILITVHTRQQWLKFHQIEHSVVMAPPRVVPPPGVRLPSNRMVLASESPFHKPHKSRHFAKFVCFSNFSLCKSPNLSHLISLPMVLRIYLWICGKESSSVYMWLNDFAFRCIQRHITVDSNIYIHIYIFPLHLWYIPFQL